MRVIGIDSSTAAGGVALVEDGVVVAEYTLQLTATHSERLLPTLERVMSDAEWEKESVSAAAVTVGPGSFTGLRIGTATAKALAYSWQVPVVGVSTLEALAWQVGWAGPIICPMVDARRQMVYTQFFRSGISRIETGGHTMMIEALTQPSQQSLPAVVQSIKEQYAEVPVILVGDGVQKNRAFLTPTLGEHIVIPSGSAVILHASSVAELGSTYLKMGRQDDPMQLVPLYLRKSEAEIKWEAQQRSKNK